MIPHLTSDGVLELASCLLKGAALILAGTLLLVGVIAWISRWMQWQTLKHLKHLPHRNEQVPFQGLWIMFKACSLPNSPVSFSTLIFSSICGLHARFQRYGRHIVYLGFTPLLTVYKAEYLEVIEERKKELEAEVNDGALVLDSTSKSEPRAKRRRPFLDLLIVEHLKNDKYITKEDIREEVDTFMFEGHDTTAVGISWALFLIGHHPQEQQKIQEELDQIFGKDKERYVSFEDLKQMRYLECALKEAQRIYPSVPIIARTCEEPFKIEVFPKPEEFHPERFFPENSKGRHPFAYLPFSAGPRNCIGIVCSVRVVCQSNQLV
ncbi:hypothetical protein HPB50_014162 [Hyalomma asiaticum]|uniref:Uncharacterized protein n=1 Tax=Hyalomma asiaticum TaxID=266040 RepID=A0ACB7TKD0_HYAAI|nr:hypothetical protein HPB50_014162 [Hyalomma asiaticum]